jgi:hypothetical protein
MATVRVSFLLGGERFHGRLNRSSVLSDVPPEATRVDRAGPGYKVIRLRGLSHTDTMARNRQYFHVATVEGRSFHLRLWQIDAILAEFQRPCGEAVPALGAFFGRCRGIDDCLRG